MHLGIRVSGLLAVALVTGACEQHSAARKQPEAQPAAAAERIAYAYHGLLLDEDMQEIPLDSISILGMQSSIIQALRRESEGQRKRDTDRLLDRDLDPAGLSAGQRMAVNDAVISSLLESAPEELKARFGWRHQLLRARAAEFYAQLDPGTKSALEQRGFGESLIQPDTAAAAEAAYLASCRTEGVPVPPDWPNPGWVFRGDLDEKFNLIGEGETKVYTYSDADGVCFALPRSDKVLMGIICQGERTGKACFFDNIDASTNKRVDWRTTPLVMASLRNGSDLEENCTNCHRGENVFIIHPGSALEVEDLDTDPSARYTPIGQSGWTNPAPLSFPPPGAGQRSCEGCHALAEPSPEYCQVVRQAARRTMPPGGTPAGWPAPAGSRWTAHINFLRSKCPDE